MSCACFRSVPLSQLKRGATGAKAKEGISHEERRQRAAPPALQVTLLGRFPDVLLGKRRRHVCRRRHQPREALPRGGREANRSGNKATACPAGNQPAEYLTEPVFQDGFFCRRRHQLRGPLPRGGREGNKGGNKATACPAGNQPVEYLAEPVSQDGFFCRRRHQLRGPLPRGGRQRQEGRQQAHRLPGGRVPNAGAMHERRDRPRGVARQERLARRLPRRRGCQEG